MKTLLSGRLPDRPPLYDTILNDAVIAHFGRETLAPENARAVVARAHGAALDATKASYRLPEFNPGRVTVDRNGRRTTHRRWTSWAERLVYDSTEDYVRAKRALTADPWDWNAADRQILDRAIADWIELGGLSGDVVRDFNVPGPPRFDRLFPEVGLEAFCYYLYDCPDVIHRQVEYRFHKVVQAIEHSDLPPGVQIVKEGCDLAFKTGLLFPPDFLRQSFIPGLARLCAAVHRQGRKVLFHSDGNLWAILDDLVEAGIDLLHPLEPLAGMDPARVHKRYPHLILCGTIDVSQLLPFGTPQEIADQVVRNIEAAEGQIMVGSSTEVHDGVPLENYVALHEAVLGYAY